tara:strand:- start:19002 stop:19574 length:573 start_codon:yes stop_codon:yes gene_type:complete
MIADISIVAVTGDLPNDLRKITLSDSAGRLVSDMYPMTKTCACDAETRVSFFCRQRVIGGRRLAVKCRVNTEKVKRITFSLTESTCDLPTDLCSLDLSVNEVLFDNGLVSKLGYDKHDNFVTMFINRAQPNQNLAQGLRGVLIPIHKTQKFIVSRIKARMTESMYTDVSAFVAACSFENNLAASIGPCIF